MSLGARSRRLQSVVLAVVLIASPAGARAERETPAGNGLFPSAVLIDDSSGNRMLLFGGTAGGEAFDDTWELSLD